MSNCNEKDADKVAGRQDFTASAAEIETRNDVSVAIESEHKQGFWRNVLQYPHAVAWSVLLSTAVIMEGFDIVLIQSLLAVPAFARNFGDQLPDGSYQLTAAWQSGLTNGAIVGEMLGLMVNGIVADHYGFKKTMIGALIAVTGFIFIAFFSHSIVQLLIALILMGIPCLRPYLTTYVNLCWVIGQFIASGVLVGVSGRDDQWAYRIPFALQWMWPIPLVVGILFAPESPWWLVRKGRLDDARYTLRRLNKQNASDESIDQTLKMIGHTNEFERLMNAGTSYLDCFKGVDLRRTEIVCVTWLIQTCAGATFMGYSTYFYQSAGLSDPDAFRLSFGQYAIGAVGTVLSWSLMGHFGRRTLFLSGLFCQLTLFLIIGFCGLASASNVNSRWAVGSMLMIFIFIYDCTVGPVTYCLVAELPSTRLRQKSVVLARNAYNIGSIICNILVTRQLNPGAWNWGAKAGFFWAGSCLLCVTWAFLRLPEPKGRTYAELDALFEHRISARKFKNTAAEELAIGSIGRQASVSQEPKSASVHAEQV